MERSIIVKLGGGGGGIKQTSSPMPSQLVVSGSNGKRIHNYRPDNFHGFLRSPVMLPNLPIQLEMAAAKASVCVNTGGA